MALDIILLLLIAGGFLLGFFRGLVRQALALGAWLILFLVGIYLRGPVAEWIGSMWLQLGRDYAQMLAFLAVFGGGFVVAFMLVQFGSMPSKLTRHPIIDDAVGGFLGVLLAVLSIAAVMVVLRTYFLGTPDPLTGEIHWLRDIHHGLEESTIGSAIHDWVIRIVGTLLSPLLPSDVRSVMA
jgi:uncharacterized membrane protein required for colicin V production